MKSNVVHDFYLCLCTLNLMMNLYSVVLCHISVGIIVILVLFAAVLYDMMVLQVTIFCHLFPLY